MRSLIIHNPLSGPNSDEIYAFAHALAAPGDEVVMRFLGEGLEADQALEDVETFDRMVLSGGDGTVSNLAAHLCGCPVPLLIFPSGTANLFFNNIGNAPDTASLAKACREGRTAKADMGELYWTDEQGAERSHTFLIIAGSGYDAAIMEKAEGMKGDLGEVAYALAALATPVPQVAHFTIEHDGQVDEMDGIACMVANTAKIQGDMNLFPNCRMDDGLLEIAVLEPAATVQLLPTLLAGILDPAGKDLGRPQFKMFSAREACITSDPALAMQFDGELLGTSNGVYGARVLPGCLNIIVDNFSDLGA